MCARARVGGWEVDGAGGEKAGGIPALWPQLHDLVCSQHKEKIKRMKKAIEHCEKP